MSLLSSRSSEDQARAYCRSIGADPDQEVGGYLASTGMAFGQWRAVPSRRWVRQSRWRWYVGASAPVPQNLNT